MTHTPDLSVVIPAEREAREPGSMYPCLALFSETGIHGSRLGSLPLAVRDDSPEAEAAA